ASALNFLHATGFGAYLKPGDELYVDDGTAIGEYVVHFDDNSTARIPIVYGKEVRDWFNWDESKPITNGKVAWEGDNQASKTNGKKIRLYLTRWENSSPGKMIRTLDYVSNGKTVCAPFCVAISAEKGLSVAENKLLGTWKHTESQNGDAKEMTKLPDSITRLKF